jgi:Trk K+ transport system NAD-binding subunit
MNSNLSQSEFVSFLVCGLGDLGQQCATVLKEFGVKVYGIELQDRVWDIPDFPKLLEQLVIGDCRQASVLAEAQIQHCQTIVLVTDDEQVNVEAAFAARSLNPEIRLVIRSAQQNLNDLLAQSLGNFVAYEATQLPAAAFALAALGDETLGFFPLENQMLRVVKTDVQPTHRWCDRRIVHELNSSTRRVLSHIPAAARSSPQFHQWEPDARIRAGDTIVHIEVNEGLAIGAAPAARKVQRGQFWQQFIGNITVQNLSQKVTQLWQSSDQSRTRRALIVCGVTVIVLLGFGTLLLWLGYGDEYSPLSAFFATALLLLGGYGDLYGDIGQKWGLQLFSLVLTLAGTALVGVLYALLTERLLTARFQLVKRRPPIPERGHVVVIGLGRVGQRVASLLHDLKQPLVGVSTADLEPGVLPQLPLVVGNLTTALERVNLAAAKSVVVVTDDQVKNLEIGLMARAANPQSHLVLRVFSQRFSENVAQLLPYAKVLGAYALSAEVFAAAAFGENILSLFRLNNQTILVTEYHVASRDSLNGRLLAEIAYGYGVVPILYQKPHEPVKLMPSDDIRLRSSDRLIVLAALEGLQQVERGIPAVQDWLVRVERATSQEAVFEGAQTIARVSGCAIGLARALMERLPGTLSVPLYKPQAQRLVRELSKAQVSAHLTRS